MHRLDRHSRWMRQWLWRALVSVRVAARWVAGNEALRFAAVFVSVVGLFIFATFSLVDLTVSLVEKSTELHLEQWRLPRRQW